MQKWILGFMFALFVFFLASCETSERQTVRLVGLGDSLTEGIGDEKDEGGYFGRVVKRLENSEDVAAVEASNFGKSGHRSEQLLERLEKEEKMNQALHDAHFITMTIGGNNVLRIVREHIFALQVEPFQKERMQYEQDLHAIFQHIRSQNEDATIFIGSIYNPMQMVTEERGDFTTIIDEWNDTIRTVGKQYGAIYVSLENLGVKDPVAYHDTDYFHPNSEGYDEIADRFLHEMSEVNIIKMIIEQQKEASNE